MLQHQTWKLHACIIVVAVLFLAFAFICLHCSRHAEQWMWAVSAIGGLLAARLLSQQGLVCAACVHALCACVCPMIKQRPSVSLTVFTMQFAFRVQLGWDTETSTDLACQFFFSFLISYSHSCAHSEVLCESLHSVFPSGRMHLFPIATIDKMLSDRISVGRSLIMTTPLMDWCEERNGAFNLQ